MNTLNELFTQAGSFPFRVQAKTGLKLTIVGKRENGKFDSKASVKATGPRTTGWRSDLAIWKAI